MIIMGNILRFDNENPMKIINFKRNNISPIEMLFYKIGRSRTQWIHNIFDIIWKYIRIDNNDFINSVTQL